MQRSRRGGRGCALVALWAAGLPACAIEIDDDPPEVDEVADVTARLDLSCHDQPLPAAAAERVTLHGFTNDSYTGGALPGVQVELRARDKDVVLDVTASDVQGVLVFEVETGSAPLEAYGRMHRDGHVTSYLFPSRPLVEDTRNVFFPVLPPAWREELAGHAGVTLDPARGIVAIIVTDCAGERVEGATVAFDPPAEAVAYWDPTFTVAEATHTTINGHAWGFNVPAGVVRATVTVGDVTYRDWPVQSFADGRSISWRAP
jgi:hypothetical protein